MWKTLFRRKTTFHSSGSSMPRVLGVRDLTFFGIAAIIGGGIFSSVGKACAEGGPGVVWLFIICAIACAFAALCYAEFAARIPVAGSAYTYAYASFGELFAWIIGWALIMEYSVGNIYIAFSWSGYVTHMLDALHVSLPRWLTVDYKTAHRVFLEAPKMNLLNTDSIDALQAWNTAPTFGSFKCILDAPAITINVLITMLVYKGIKESKNVSNVMVWLKLVIIVAVIVVGGFYIDFDNYTPFNPSGMSGIMAGVSAVFFTYIGFDAISTLAEESKNPKRDLPLGMFYALIICTVLYVLITLVLTGMVPYKLLNVDDPLAFALQYKGVHWLEYIVGASAIIAMTGVLLVFQMGQPRIWMSMSRDGLLPRKFAEIHPKHKTPSFSTIITGFVVGVPILFTDESFVLDFTSIGTIFAFVLVCGGVLLLPQRPKVENQGFRLWYINGKWLYGFLLLISGVLVYRFIPDYFSDLIYLNSHDMFHSSHRIMWVIFIILGIFSFKNSWNIIPLMGVSICLYLLTGMTIDNWIWFGWWFLIGLILYFYYGRRNSVLNNEKG
jgi:basic amino acid/polyamine antiporter, APA family